MTAIPGRLHLQEPDAWLETLHWPGAAPEALILLHEGLGSARLWRDVPQALAAQTGLPAFAYSRLGYGDSDPCPLPRPLDYMAREAALLPQILDHALDQTSARRAILIGHSDGASIAALYGAKADPRVIGLVLIAPHFFVEDISIRAIQTARDAYENGALRRRLARHHADPDAAFRGWNDAWLDPEFRGWDITACLAQIPVPILAVQGRDDPYGTPAQVHVIADHARTKPQIHLLEACKHARHLDQPEATLALISDFARRLAGSEPD
ncbi:MAG: alpha/beta hydrolase [Pseudomonadota bacterium]